MFLKTLLFVYYSLFIQKIGWPELFSFCMCCENSSSSSLHCMPGSADYCAKFKHRGGHMGDLQHGRTSPEIRMKCGPHAKKNMRNTTSKNRFTGREAKKNFFKAFWGHFLKSKTILRPFLRLWQPKQMFDISRDSVLFYPPVLGGVGQQMTLGDGKWLVTPVELLKLAANGATVERLREE